MATKKRKALGRGLDAILDIDDVETSGSSSINEVELSSIHANPNQPRRDFDQDALRELSESIIEVGLIQPITLREVENGTYQIIAGERRYRACQLAGLDSIPAYVRTVDDEQVVSMALVENIQREDLNAIEIALGYQHLMDDYQLTQEKVSERVGKKRATVANYLRLLKLPAPVQLALQRKEIEMGHARALLPLQNAVQQVRVFEEILKCGYSVRHVERIVKELLAGEHVLESKKTPKAQQPELFEMLQKQLSGFFDTSVKLTCSDKGKGKISIPFKSESELEKIMELFDSLK